MSIITFAKQELDQYIEDLNTCQETSEEPFFIKSNEDVTDDEFDIDMSRG